MTRGYNVLLLVLALAVFCVIMQFPVGYAVPYGANVTPQTEETSPPDNATGDYAIAGNVSELTIKGYSNTQSWQGYYGNVTGVIQLADNDDRVMYNWSVASPTGEVYASTNYTIYWIYTQCFNLTASGKGTDDERGLAGLTNTNGTNVTMLEELFGINSTGYNDTMGQAEDEDAVSNTFRWVQDPVNGHELFYTNNLQFSDGECPSMRTFDNTTAAVQGNFEEVMLFEPESSAVIWTALMEKDLPGFDNATHDFQMIVPENGHGTNTGATLYYFYVELS